MYTADAETSDPRDKIFALGSFSFETGIEALEPDYSLSAEQIFMRATKHLLLHDQALIVLHLAGIGSPRKNRRLPSWVPHYSFEAHPTTSTKVVSGLSTYKALYSAASMYTSETPTRIKLGPLDNSLAIFGVVVDTISVTCEPLRSPKNIWDSLISESADRQRAVIAWFNEVRRLFCTDLRPIQPYRNGKDGTKFDALLQVLVAGVHEHELSAGDYRDYSPRQGFDDFLKVLLHVSVSDPGDKLQDMSPQILGSALGFIRAMDKLAGWTVFETKKGYLGQGPPLVRSGDKVCVFKGGRTPFVIREFSSGMFGLFRRYSLVGECYVEGLMHKEAAFLSGWGDIVLV